MRKIPQIYDSTVKYIVSQTQRHLKMLYNPIYQERMVSRNDEDIFFYEIEKMTLKVKKDYKQANGEGTIPKRINIISEQDRAKMARERLKKRAEMEQEGDKKVPVPKKKDIILTPDIPSSGKNHPPQVGTSSLEKKPAEKKIKFEILKEEVDYASMIKENKVK